MLGTRIIPRYQEDGMRKVKLFLAVIGMALASLPVTAAPAGAVVCHDQPGMCCEDPVILGKPIDIPMDC
jgi:hypothetical protein